MKQERIISVVRKWIEHENQNHKYLQPIQMEIP